MSPKNGEGGPVAETAAQIAAAKQEINRKPTGRVGHEPCCRACRWACAEHRAGGLLADPPGTFGLSARELRAHALELARSGWQPWEIAARLADPATVGSAA